MPRVDNGKKIKGKEISQNNIDKGLKGNDNMNIFMGNIVNVKLNDGSLFSGLCTSVKPNIKLINCYELPALGFQEFVFPEETIQQEKTFEYNDIINIKMATKGASRKFLTDAEYKDNAKEVSVEISDWICESIDTPLDNETSNTAGWSVNEMFKKNESLGVRSTFVSDLSQYTTCAPDGTDADRVRADEIARAIENNPVSKRYAKLENDDEERDLDKETVFEAEEQTKKNARRNKGQQHENPRAQALRSANVGGSKFNRQRDRSSNYTKQQSGTDYRRNQGDDANSPVNANLSKKRTEELRTWSNNFNDAYQPPKAPVIASVPPIAQTEDSSNSTPVVTNDTALDEAPQKAETPSNKEFKFNPEAKTFVPRIVTKSSPQTVTQQNLGQPPLSNYVIAQMPPNTTIIPNFVPQVPIVYSTQMTQPMQGAPPLIAQPNIVMSNDMHQNYLSQQPVILQHVQHNIPQQQMPRNGNRKIVSNGQPIHPSQQRMVAPPQNVAPSVPQSTYQNATYIPQQVYMTSVSMNNAGVPIQQPMQLSRPSAPCVYVYPRTEFTNNDHSACSQPPTPGSVNQSSSSPVNYQVIMPQQQKPPQYLIPNQVRMPPLMPMPNQQHQRKPSGRRRNDNN